jgi:hypothetical protein
MKSSIETKVAAAIAAGVIAITGGAMAQTQSSGQGPNEYAPSTSPSINTHMGNRGYNDASSSGQNQQSFADQAAPSNRQAKTTKHKAGKSSKHRTRQNQQNQETQSNGTGH